MRLLFDKSFMQPDDMVELLRHRGLEIDLADNTLRKKIAARFGLTVPVSEIPPVSNRLALESLLKEMSYSSILGTMSRFVLLPNC